ncbi:DDB1- and CUL4-associated factor 5 isoform X1 [Poecilia latipinna]|uniref:Ddb1 and cul4 associated factor 5 n=2 Tax=Poecilia latipinna TaxID=48699 RepID=A0A3B3TTE4_9TELE|nr:PREDICTED: DDB1- and CUL4-associated factor 5 isoform X1 [Poecilia latipinna]
MTAEGRRGRHEAAPRIPRPSGQRSVVKMKELKGCGMRCSVGFLSRRELTGQPLMKDEFQRRRLAGCTSLYKKNLEGHFGCVNAIEFSNNGGEYLVSGGDDRRVLLWDIEKAIHSHSKPVKLKGEHLSNIFCLAFDSSNSKVFSGGNDEQVILHDVESQETLNVFLHIDAVYSLSVSPVNDSIFASSSDDGRVLIWDTREPSHGEPFCLASYPSAFHSVMFNPVEPRLLATANSKEGVGLWDIRKPRSSLLRYGGSMSLQSAMSVRFNSTGTQLLALRRRLPPVLYELHSRLPSFQFDNQGYFNSCTMKSCCFAGDKDQYILSGSDDFNLYMWKIPNDPEAGGPGRVVNGAFMVLKGHRSIVNQVRFNPHSYMICSSGVEKVIKVWSPYRQPDSEGDLEGRVEDRSRSLYSHEEYISLVLNSGSGLSHDYVSQSIEEDPRMMAFFDSLVRREIEGWSSDSDSDLSEEAIMQLHARGRRSTRAASAAPVVASAADRRTDSDNSSSSSLAGPDASGGEDRAAGEDGEECPRRQRRRPQHQSGFLANEDSDSSEFWLDPMPRPRSPSPRENSTLSSPSNSPSLPAEASSSSTSTSSSSSDDEERRSAVRRQNVVRRRRMNVVSRAGNRPESIQALFSAIDSYSYPSISVDDLSSSSSDDEPNSLEIKPRASASREEEKRLSPSEFVCLSPVMSPESQDNNGSDRTEQGGRSVASPRLLDELGSPNGGEANDVSTVADGVSQSRRSPGVNGQHRPVSPSNQRASSESEDEIGTLAEEPRPQREKGLAQSALKRTHVGSEEAELGLSSSEKKLKT